MVEQQQLVEHLVDPWPRLVDGAHYCLALLVAEATGELHDVHCSVAVQPGGRLILRGKSESKRRDGKVVSNYIYMSKRRGDAQAVSEQRRGHPP